MRHRDPRSGRYAAKPLPPPAPDPLLFPSYHAPRLRLRLYDQRWPWRRTLEEVIDDAIASGNAWVDRDTRRGFVRSPAMVQRDPPLMGGQPIFRDCTDAGRAARAERERQG